jgi:hypothetical protein
MSRCHENNEATVLYGVKDAHFLRICFWNQNNAYFLECFTSEQRWNIWELMHEFDARRVCAS